MSEEVSAADSAIEPSSDFPVLDSAVSASSLWTQSYGPPSPQICATAGILQACGPPIFATAYRAPPLDVLLVCQAWQLGRSERDTSIAFPAFSDPTLARFYQAGRFGSNLTIGQGGPNAGFKAGPSASLSNELPGDRHGNS